MDAENHVEAFTHLDLNRGVRHTRHYTRDCVAAKLFLCPILEERLRGLY